MTALQELIDKWKVIGDKIELTTFRGVIREAESFLEKEKQQIIDAYENGVTEEQRRCAYENGQEYYKETYE